MEEKLLAAQEESDDEESSSSSSSDSSASSNIGLRQGQKAGKSKAAKAKAKRKSTQKQKPEDSGLSEKPDASEKAEKTGKPIGASAVLEKSKAALSSLKEATAFAMWSNSIKQKDITTRVSKGLDCSSKCEGFPAEPALGEILPLLTEEVNRVSPGFI